MKNLLAVIAVSFFAFQSFAAPMNAQESAEAPEVAALKKEVADLKLKIGQIEKDYYDSLSENMKRQNRLRAEIRRLKDELEEAKKSAAPAAAILDAMPAKAPSAAKETFDKDREYREALERKMNGQNAQPSLKPEAKNSPEPEKSESPESAQPSEKGSSFWDRAFPF